MAWYGLVAKSEREESRLHEDERRRFEELLLPHLGAAYNLARWLTGGAQDAEDLVQEAYLRALKSFTGFQGTDGRVWLLAIVRNSCYTWLRLRRARATAAFDEGTSGVPADGPSPEAVALREEDRQAVRRAIDTLPPEYREVVVLREIEGLAYKEIAAVSRIPLGTVMSRLARARAQLQQQLGPRMAEEA